MDTSLFNYSQNSSSRVDSETYIKEFLYTNLPRSDRNELEDQLKKYFPLEKRGSDKRKQHRRKKTVLTRKERIKYGLLHFPKNQWKYIEMQPIRDMWKQYMSDNLKLFKHIPTPEDSEWPNFSLLLAKTEFIGAEMTVVRSKCSSYIGISGTCVYETKFAFYILQKNNKCLTILKEHSVFRIECNGLKFTIFGKHLLTRSAERSSKKIRTQMLPDLL